MDFAFVIENNDFFNWTGSVFAMTDTKASLHKFIGDTSLQHLESWPQDQKNHIRDFVIHNMHKPFCLIYHHTGSYILNCRCHNPGTKELYNLQCSCFSCRNVYDRLEELKTSPKEPLQLNTASIISEDWWILLKMFLPKGDTNVESLEQCDVAAFCSLLERCQLFDEIDNTKLEQIISIRNKLMHSSTNEISQEEKRKNLDHFEKFLSFTSFSNRSEVEEMIRKIQNDKFGLFHFVSALDEFKEVQGAFDIQERAIKRDLENFKEMQLDRPGLENMLAKVQKNQVVIEELIDIKGQLTGTLDQAVQMGKREGAKALGSSFIGSISGGTGAYVAGQYKKLSNYNN